jgi:hypothetical protein
MIRIQVCTYLPICLHTYNCGMSKAVTEVRSNVEQRKNDSSSRFSQEH